MFGKLELPEKPKPKIIEVPTVTEDGKRIMEEVSVMPKTNYKTRLMLYEQRKNAIAQELVNNVAISVKNDRFDTRFLKHTSDKKFTRDLTTKVNKKMEEYNRGIEKRREKLRDILWIEEREQIREVVEQADKSEDYRMRQMKIRLQELRAKKEDDRVKFVHEKCLQQYMQKCDEIRPIIASRNREDLKRSYFQQMKEKELRKASERELDVMWHDLKMKELEAMNERAIKDENERKKRNSANLAVWDMQIKATELNAENKKREKHEDLLRMEKLKQDQMKDKLAKIEEAQHVRQDYVKSLRTQIKEQEEVLAQRKRDEMEFKRVFDSLIEEELHNERMMGKDRKSANQREMAQYRTYLAQLNKEKLEEEKRLDQLVQETMKDMNEKQDKAKSELVKARQALRESVAQGVQEQIQHRRKEAEEQLKLKEIENQLVEMTMEQNERLERDYARRQTSVVREYRDDLKKQMEYSKLQKEQEKEEYEKQLAQGKLEEDNYKKILQELIVGEYKFGGDHPFKKVLTKETCACPIK